MKKEILKILISRVWPKTKQILKDFWSLLKSLVELVFGGSFFIVLSMVGILYTFFKHVWKLDYNLRRQLVPIMRAILLATDGIANASASEMLNDATNPVVKYGKWYHTISAISGINLIKKGKHNLATIVDKVLGRNHCTDAITDEQKCFYKL